MKLQRWEVQCQESDRRRISYPHSLGGESLPLAPTACGATPSSGGLPRNAPVEPPRLVERLNPPARPLLRRAPTTAPSNSLRRILEDRDLPGIPPSPSGGRTACGIAWSRGPSFMVCLRLTATPSGGGGASEATMVSPQQSAVLATAPAAACRVSPAPPKPSSCQRSRICRMSGSGAMARRVRDLRNSDRRGLTSVVAFYHNDRKDPHVQRNDQISAP
jgi:hypothetical protein